METPALQPSNVQPWAEQIPVSWIMSAKKGCSQCHGKIRIPPKAPPFAQGPHVGRYLCMDCWVLNWSMDPGALADEDTRKFVAGEAARIQLRRKAAVLFQDGDLKIYQTNRGTLVFDIPAKAELAPNEFDKARLEALLKAVNAVSEKKSPEAVQVG